PEAWALLVELLNAAGEEAAAAKGYEQARQAFPADDRWLKGLARIYLLRQDNEKLLPILTELAIRDGDNVTLRKKLAQLTLAAGAAQARRRWAAEALARGLRDAACDAWRAAAEAALARHEIAEREYETARRLDGSQPDSAAGLARAQIAQ